MAETGALLFGNTRGDDSTVHKALPSVSSDEAHYMLLGTQDFPLVEVKLEPGCSMCAEPGRLIQLPEGVKFHSVFGDGTEAGVLSNMGKAASRMFSGESISLARFTNETDYPQTLRFGTVIPGHLLPIKLSDYGGAIIGMNGVYFLGSSGLRIASCFRQSLGAAFFGGESFILQRIEAPSGDGAVLLQGGGTVIKEELTPERPMLKIDTGCLVAFTQNLKYEVAPAGGLKSWIFGGEGIFFATVTLPPGESKGTVWMESFPYNKYLSLIKSKYAH